MVIQYEPNDDSDKTSNAEADLNHCWTHMTEGTFIDVVAQNTADSRYLEFQGTL